MTEKKKKSNLNAFVLLLIIMLIAAILTWIVPAGQFERAEDPNTGRMVVVPGTYQTVESTPIGVIQFVTSIYAGFMDAADITFFIIFASTYVFLLNKSGTLTAACGAMLRLVGDRDNLIIPIFMTLFAIGGTTFGMYEETYALIPAFIIIAMTLGYDRIVGGAIVFVGVATGFAAATINPFTIGVAAGVAGVPLTEPKVLIFRIVAFVAFLVLVIAYTMAYASKVKKDPTKSIVYGLPQEETKHLKAKDEILNMPFTGRQKIAMVGFAALIVILTWGIITAGWWFQEIASLFLVFFVATGLLLGYGPNELGNLFVESSKETIYGALIVGMARGISVVLTAGGIIDTIVFALGNLVSSLPTALTGIGMLIVQNLINLFIPSGSGQAVVTMPIMAPLADVVGISRQMACVAYQFGDGFSNMFWPTGVATICGFMSISLAHWYKFVTKLFAMMFALQCVFMVAGIMIGI